MSPEAPEVECIRDRPTVIRRRRWKVVDPEEPSVIWKNLAKYRYLVRLWHLAWRRDFQLFAGRILLVIIAFAIDGLVGFVAALVTIALFMNVLYQIERKEPKS